MMKNKQSDSETVSQTDSGEKNDHELGVLNVTRQVQISNNHWLPTADSYGMPPDLGGSGKIIPQEIGVREKVRQIIHEMGVLNYKLVSTEVINLPLRKNDKELVKFLILFFVYNSNNLRWHENLVEGLAKNSINTEPEFTKIDISEDSANKSSDLHSFEGEDKS